MAYHSCFNFLTAYYVILKIFSSSVPPQDPEILNTELYRSEMVVVRASQGEVLTLECVSRGGFPLQTVEWYENSVANAPLSTILSTNETVDGKFDVTASYTFTPTATDDMNLYFCQSSYSTEPRLTSHTAVRLLLNCE